ncbi:MAG: sulfatase-like hydrolase/transferase, partial [Bacteroidales bacterium]|nr:sulfatase-like hydrolase/transferase [Bacteroidales bacterium]
AFFPKVPESRLDMADYLCEIEWADRVLGEIVDILESRGLDENTIIIFTSDNGMPFPRSKATLYDHGVRMPLIVYWKSQIKGMRVVSDPVNLIELAPTILDLAGIDIPAQMTGRNIGNLLFSEESGSIDSDREFVITAFEKHTHCRPNELGYPRRAIHTEKWTYIINYEPERYPMGDSDIFIPNWDILGETDPGQLKEYYKRNMGNSDFSYYYELAFGKAPGEQLFYKMDDPDMIHNMAEDPVHYEIKIELKNKLETYLIETNDPRAHGMSPWDEYKLDK